MFSHGTVGLAKFNVFMLHHIIKHISNPTATKIVILLEFGEVKEVNHKVHNGIAYQLNSS